MLGLSAFQSTEADGANVVSTRVAGEFRYDSNTDTGSTGSGEDYVSVLAPQIEFISEGPKTRLNALYRLTGSYYLSNDHLNHLSHEAEAGANTQLSASTRLQAAYHFRYTEESREATTMNIQTSRTGIYSHTATLGATHVFTSKISAALNASESLLEFDDPALVDTRTDAAGLTASYILSERTTLGSTYSFTNMAFDTGTDVQTHAVDASVDHRYSPTLELNASAGVVFSESGDADWQAAAGIVKTLPKGSFSASYARGVTNSSGLTDQININDFFSAVLSHSISERLSLGLSASYSINKSSPERTVDLRSYQAGVSASWRARNWLTLGAAYSYYNQDSQNSLALDSERNTVSLTFVIEPYEYRN